MSSLVQDVRFAFRTLAKAPGFTLAAVVMLALAIGANSAIFSVVHSVLLERLPYGDPERVVMVWEQRPKEGMFDNVVSPADYIDWQAQNQVFEYIAAYTQQTADIVGAGDPERVTAGAATADLFNVLGVRPQLGRLFQTGDDVEGQHLVVVLSDGLWMRKYGGDPAIVGRKINLSGRDFEVIGVTPPEFRLPYAAELWAPMPFSAQTRQARGAHFLFVFARLKQGVTVAQAQSGMATLSSQIEQQNPAVNEGHSAKVVLLREQLSRDVQPMLVVLLGAVGFVVLIACANVANLLLARGAGRYREVSIRAALGAGRWRLVRQLLVESLMLSLTAGGIGVLLALWSTDAMKMMIPRNVVTIGLDDFGVNAPVLWFTLGLCVATGLLFGLLPAIQATRVNLAEALKAGGRGFTGSRSRRRLRASLVVAEIGLSVVLLTGAGLMMRTLVELYSVSPGFRAENLLTSTVAVPRSRYPSNDRIFQFYQDALSRVRAMPGVVNAAAVSHLPLSGQDSRTGIAPDGRERRPDEAPRRMHYRQVSVGYFETMGIPLLEGRLLNQFDIADSKPVMVINQAAARRFWEGQSAVGHFVVIGGSETRWEIVGVVGNTRHWALGKDVNPEMYLPIAQQPTPFMTIVTRTAGEPMGLAGALREQLQALDPQLPISAPRTMDDVIAQSESQRTFVLSLIGAFAGLGLILAGLGIYAVLAYNVTQRTHEMGVRMALGAKASDIRSLVMREGLTLGLLGISMGVAGALYLTRFLEKQLFEVRAKDPLTMVVVAAVLLTVALLASWLPARRATKVDPMVALRYE